MEAPLGDTWACLVCSLRLLGALWESLSVLGRSLGVLGRHCVLLEVSLGSPGAPQNVENELGSSSGASVGGNATKPKGFSMIFKTCQSFQRRPLVSLGVPWGVLGVLGYPWRAPRDVLGGAMGVLGGPLGHLWESLRVPWGHLGSACGALAVLKIIEKPVLFLCYFQVWGTLGRHLSVSGLFFGVVGCSLGVIGRSSGVLGRSLGVPWASLRALGVALGVLGFSWRVPTGSQGPSGSSGFSTGAPDLASIASSHDVSSIDF